ncbi:hypothetical protein, partial [Micromonospora sp. NPDC005171]|uniref:hypothetical protein n=1 Tax=Micromonospora sp. NPDC005171 TaxID=3156866 RepID=UPI00339DFD67
HSLPTRVNPQVVTLTTRAPVAQGIEHRFPKPHAILSRRLMTCGFPHLKIKNWSQGAIAVIAC